MPSVIGTLVFRSFPHSSVRAVDVANPSAVPTRLRSRLPLRVKGYGALEVPEKFSLFSFICNEYPGSPFLAEIKGAARLARVLRLGNGKLLKR